MSKTFITPPLTKEELDPGYPQNWPTQVCIRHNIVENRVMGELSSDPPDPQEGHYTIWMSDGTGSGFDGDIMIKITAGGVTKTTTLVDFSAV